MRFLRLLILVVAIAGVYIAQYIFLHQTLQTFFPQKLLDLLPGLTRLARWLPEDLLRGALWSSGLSLLAVGLVTTAWHTEWKSPPLAVLAVGQRPLARLATFFNIVAILLATGDCVLLWLTGQENLPGQLTWVGALLLFFIGQIGLQSAVVTDEVPHGEENTILVRSARTLLLILFCAGILFGWQLTTSSAPLSAEVVEMGLKALTLAHGAEAQFFAHTQTTFTEFALMPTALAIWLSGDALLGVRLVGLSAGLLLILATWLLGSELFRRTPIYGRYGEAIEDAGQWPTVVATALVAVNVVMLVFSRLPIYLEPVVWGTFGFWAWLHGMRQGNRLSLALSGVLIGLALILYQNGLLFLFVMPFGWLGYWLLRPAGSSRSLPALRWPALTWLSGVWVASAPLIGIWLRSPELLLGRKQGVFFDNLMQLPAALNLAVLPTDKLTYPFAGMSAVVAPLLILAIGCLLLNLDQLTGWLLTTWIGLMVIGSALMATQPDSWPVLLPLIPALALTLAFTLDRLRTTFMETADTWLIQATTYLAVGLILWSGQSSWIEYKQFVRGSTSEDRSLGFVLRDLALSTRPLVFVQPDQDSTVWTKPIVRFLTNERDLAAHLQVVPPNALPTTLPAHTVVFWQVANETLLQDLQTRYPDGSLITQRDELANPIAFLYVLP